jgi:hypothetical protein
MKIISNLYSDSIIRENVHCGRTKVEAIAENGHTLKLTELTLQAVTTSCVDAVPFSEASKKGNCKLFPNYCQLL